MPYFGLFINGLKCRDCGKLFRKLSGIELRVTTNSTPERTVVKCGACGKYNFDADEATMIGWFEECSKRGV